MNYKSLEHFRYSFKNTEINKIRCTRNKLNSNVKKPLDGFNIRYYNFSRKNKNNKNNRSFSY